MGFWRWGKEPHDERKADAGYVSEFGRFMENFLEEHPEEIDERLKGWFLYWDHRAGNEASGKGTGDQVPDDRYGFDYSAWRRAKEQGSSGHSR